MERRPVERRLITAAAAEDQLVNARRIAPGIWVDADDNLHISVPDLMQMVDLEDTPENRAAILHLVEKLISAQGGSYIVQDVRPD